MVAEFLEVSEAEARDYIVGERFDLRPMIIHYSHGVGLYSPSRGRAACIVLAAGILLVTGSYMVDFRIVPLVIQSFDGFSLVPYVLGETLNGLDRVFHNREEFFRGSPRLLFMWLTERFRLVSDAFLPPTYTSSDFFHRSLSVLAGTTPVRVVRMLASNFEEIRWFVPWWGLNGVVLELNGLRHVPLRGLRYTSYYIPMRVRRQFNIRQRSVWEPLLIDRNPTYVDGNIGQRLLEWWNGRQARLFHVRGIRPLPRQLVLDQAEVLMNNYTLHQMRWAVLRGVPHMDVEGLAEDLADTYAALEEERRVRTLLDYEWPPF